MWSVDFIKSNTEWNRDTMILLASATTFYTLVERCTVDAVFVCV